MEIVKVDINELISPEYNPRQITDEEMEKLKNSINEFGYIAPIIVNKHNKNWIWWTYINKAEKHGQV